MFTGTHYTVQVLMNSSFQDVGTVGCCKKSYSGIRYKLGVRARVAAAAVSLHYDGDPDTWLSTSSSKGNSLSFLCHSFSFFFFVVVVVRFQVVLFECD
jgi:hypothetical protein